MSSCDDGGIKRRRRTTKQEQAILEALFRESSTPSLEARERVCSLVDMPMKKLQVWLQNRRQKEKKDAGKWKPAAYTSEGVKLHGTGSPSPPVSTINASSVPGSTPPPTKRDPDGDENYCYNDRAEHGAVGSRRPSEVTVHVKIESHPPSCSTIDTLAALASRPKVLEPVKTVQHTHAQSIPRVNVVAVDEHTSPSTSSRPCSPTPSSIQEESRPEPPVMSCIPTTSSSLPPLRTALLGAGPAANTSTLRPSLPPLARSLSLPMPDLSSNSQGPTPVSAPFFRSNFPPFLSDRTISAPPLSARSATFPGAGLPRVGSTTTTGDVRTQHSGYALTATAAGQAVFKQDRIHFPKQAAQRPAPQPLWENLQSDPVDPSENQSTARIPLASSPMRLNRGIRMEDILGSHRKKLQSSQIGTSDARATTLGRASTLPSLETVQWESNVTAAASTDLFGEASTQSGASRKLSGSRSASSSRRVFGTLAGGMGNTSLDKLDKAKSHKKRTYSSANAAFSALHKSASLDDLSAANKENIPPHDAAYNTQFLSAQSYSFSRGERPALLNRSRSFQDATQHSVRQGHARTISSSATRPKKPRHGSLTVKVGDLPQNDGKAVQRVGSGIESGYCSETAVTATAAAAAAARRHEHDAGDTSDSDPGNTSEEADLTFSSILSSVSANSSSSSWRPIGEGSGLVRRLMYDELLSSDDSDSDRELYVALGRRIKPTPEYLKKHRKSSTRAESSADQTARGNGENVADMVPEVKEEKEASTGATKPTDGTLSALASPTKKGMSQEEKDCAAVLMCFGMTSS